MAGFALMVERLGSEKSYHTMDQIYEILIHKVQEFEGTVNEMTGDGIMALFGAPIALEDAPQRALWSALSIHREIARFNEQNKNSSPVRMRIGIHTGPVVVGTLGNDLRVEFKAVGNTVNLAARMEQLAKPETTYVTEETFKLTNELFQFETVGKKAVKGKGTAIPVYRVLSGKENVYRPRLGSERMIYAEMVGRDAELDRLELQIMKTINGKGSIVNISGEAGIGKSRLVAELKKREAVQRVALFEGRSISIGKNLSFHPIIDLLKKWAQIREDDGEAMALGKLESAVRSICLEKAGEVLPFVATLMGMKLSGRYAERIKGIEGEALENLILKNVRELIIKASEQTPLVIVLEDLHWADLSSIELAESLFRLAETQRILFINVLRPGYKQTGDRIVETVKKNLPVYSIEIVLEPLNEKMSEILITNVLNVNVLQHEIIRQIVQRAGGNPFFIEEVARSLIDEQAVVLKDGAFQVTEKIGTIAIPNTINDVLMARIDRLEEETRNLVKIASVVGKNFFYRILAEVAGNVDDIDGRLSYLKEIQIIEEHRRMDEVEYSFKHALAQEIAYESILPRKRMELHLKVAGSIEKVFSERLHEFYGMLAYHYSKAENLEKAEEFLINAGEEALRSSASNEALHYYQEALKLYLNKYGTSADSEKVATLEKRIALALYNRGQYDEAVEYFDKALAFYNIQLPQNTISTLLKFLSAFVQLMITLYFPSLKFKKIPGHKDVEIVDLLYKKIKALSMINPKRFFLEAFYAVRRISNFDMNKLNTGPQMFVGGSTLFSFTGISFRLSRKILDSARGIVSNDDTRNYTTYELVEAIHNFLEGNWRSIKAYDDDLVNKNLSLGEIWDASQHLYWHGFLNIYQGSLDIAQQIVKKLEEIFQDYENEISISFKYELSAHLLMEYRKFHDALFEINKGINFAPKMGLNYFLMEMYSCQALNHIFMRDFEKAETALTHAHNIRCEVDAAVPFQLSSLYRSQMQYDLYQLAESTKTGNISLSSEYRKKALNSGKQFLKISRKTAHHRTESYKLMGLYYWLIEKQENALSWWNKAIEEGKRLEAPLSLSRTYFEVGKRLLEPQSKYKMLREYSAKEYLIKAKTLFERMDLQWDLDELDQAQCG
jgi:class 3 adenylate cyclase/tetratricopeptide (TPR) repeat protein